MSESATAAPAGSAAETSISSAQLPASRKWRRRVLVVLGFMALLALIDALAPSPIDPVGYTPPPPVVLTGWLAPNEMLRQAKPLAAGQLAGPEDIDVDDQGRIYTGTEDGKIWRIEPSGQAAVFAETGGRPLGVCLAPDGRHYVADGIRGLLSVDRQGQVAVLATSAAGRPFGFTDDLDVAADGTIYFSDASDKFGTGEYLYDLLEGRPHGRLLRLRPGTTDAEVLLDGLYFANGVALSKDEDFVLVNETYRYRITRLWLSGPQAGIHEVWADNLPGFPDNLTCDDEGQFWVAMFTVRNATLDSLSPWPSLKRRIARLPKMFWPKPAPYGLVLRLDAQGHGLASYHDPGGQRFVEVTSAQHRGGSLYFGSLHHDRVGRLAIEPATGAVSAGSP